jgi:hypothetical protein
MKPFELLQTLRDADVRTDVPLCDLSHGEAFRVERVLSKEDLYCERCASDLKAEYVDEYGRFLCEECRVWFYRMLDRSDLNE